ncbi:MAG: chromate transporter [Lachnospiraceae bacterium]|nr:chromate transporter [Lachnospiraceae bacterium]
MKELFDLYIAFLKIGAVNFGGGYAMLPLLEEDLNKKRGWVTTEELMDYFAIGQCTPGVIALNVATFIGNKMKGVAGAAAATIGFLTCPVILILIIAAFLTNFADIPLVQNAFAGIRVCVCVLILEAVIRLWKKSIVDVTAFVIYAIIFILMVTSDLLPVDIPAAVLVVAAGVAGVLIRGHREVSR